MLVPTSTAMFYFLLTIIMCFVVAMDWVYVQEEEFMPQYLVDEMNGMGAGMCAAVPHTSCNTTQMQNLVKRVNMLPELIRMACTAYGAWDKATPDGKLVQLRALDFGAGPFANHSVIITYREEGQRSVTSVSWPGFVGAVTGIAQDGVGISEKVVIV